jgi:hypothetical protein
MDNVCVGCDNIHPVRFVTNELNITEKISDPGSLFL